MSIGRGAEQTTNFWRMLLCKFPVAMHKSRIGPGSAAERLMPAAIGFVMVLINSEPSLIAIICYPFVRLETSTVEFKIDLTDPLLIGDRHCPSILTILINYGQWD